MNYFRAFLNSPVGPKTTHFWGPMANWGFVISGLMDSKKPADAISGNMTSGTCLRKKRTSLHDLKFRSFHHPTKKKNKKMYLTTTAICIFTLNYIYARYQIVSCFLISLTLETLEFVICVASIVHECQMDGMRQSGWLIIAPVSLLSDNGAPGCRQVNENHIILELTIHL